jgi:hypothetical protein
METVVSILLMTLFMSIALQGIVIAKLVQAKTIALADANRWVQTDIEAVRSQLSLTNFNITDPDRYCRANTQMTGFGKIARDRLAGVEVNTNDSYELPVINIPARSGQPLEIQRTATISATDSNYNYKLLGIEYRVMPTGDRQQKKPVLTLYTEVMPDAALQCP